MQVFLDADILLNYLEGKEVDSVLPELLKLSSNKEIVLLTTSQIKDEYLRNVATVKNKKINELKGSSIMMNNIEYKDKKSFKNRVRKESQKIIEKNNKQENKILKEIKNFKTRESYIEKFFTIAISFDEDKSILEKSYFRYLKGNPPRKKKEKSESYGDAINWELILRDADKKDELIIVSRDGDYSEVLYKEISLNSLLISDWKKVSRKKIDLFNSLGEFVNKCEKEEIVNKKLIAEEKESIKEDIMLQQSMDNYDNNKRIAALQLLKDYVKEIMASLSPREQRILEMRFGLIDGVAHILEEVGQEFELTRERIRQIEAKVFEKIRKTQC